MNYRLSWVAAVVLFGALLAASPALASKTAPSDCKFILGIETLKGLVDATEGPATVGECIENQRFDAHGNAEQRTSRRSHGLAQGRQLDRVQ